MSDRVDELKGDIKQGVGKITRNERLEAEGETDANAARAKRRVKGSVREAGGQIKEGVGKVTGDKSMEAKGKAQRRAGESARLK
jgi:uncharacterized protein YjbJ (UPF0337 family)